MATNSLKVQETGMVPLEVVNLPYKIIKEILSWLPVKSLLRFKSVCKQWYCLIDQDKKFIVKHMIRASPTWLETEEKFETLSSLAGLFLEENVTSQARRIRNPATRQVVSLPDAHEGLFQMEFVFNSLTTECKVVSVYLGKEDNLFSVEIVTIGTDDKGRSLKLPNQISMLEEHGREVVVKNCFAADNDRGLLHFTETIANGHDLYLQVHSLDMGSECFTTTTLPGRAFLDLNKVQTFLWDGRPAVADIAEGALNVLVLEDFKEHKWSENKVIVPLKFLENAPLFNDDQIAIVSAESNLIWFFNYMEDQEYSYDLIKKKFEKVVGIEQTHKRYRPSLVTLKGMRPERDIC